MGEDIFRAAAPMPCRWLEKEMLETQGSMINAAVEVGQIGVDGALEVTKNLAEGRGLDAAKSMVKHVVAAPRKMRDVITEHIPSETQKLRTKITQNCSKCAGLPIPVSANPLDCPIVQAYTEVASEHLDEVLVAVQRRKH